MLNTYNLSLPVPFFKNKRDFSAAAPFGRQRKSRREFFRLSPAQTVDKPKIRKSLAEFFASQREKSFKIRFFRGHAPRKKHFSACKCASVPRKRVRAAGCIPSVDKAFRLCRQLERERVFSSLSRFSGRSGLTAKSARSPRSCSPVRPCRFIPPCPHTVPPAPHRESPARGSR